MMTLLTWLFDRARCLALVLAVHLSLVCTAAAGSPTLVAQPGVVAPASIAELARALRYDALLIYEYVYTNIEYTPTYGAKKGALGSILDGAGNDIDQASLLVALLRQSGYTASFVRGRIRLTPAQATAWLGTDSSSWCPVGHMLLIGGLPFDINVSDPSDCNSAWTVDIEHWWVAATGGSLGSTTYAFDPSYKTYTSSTGINLASAIGYNQTNFVNAAKSGSTSGGNSIQNLNTQNIANSLTAYASSLVSYIKTNMPTATPKEVIGGRYVQPLTQPYTPPTTLPYLTPGYVPEVLSEIPNFYHSRLRIQIGGIDRTFNIDQIYGHRLTIVYDSSNRPNLYVDGVLYGTGAANATTISFVARVAFCIHSGNPCNFFSFQNVIQAGNGYTYAIVNGWDVTGRGMVEFHRRQLQANKAAGQGDNSEAVLGEALNMIGYAWVAQASAEANLIDRVVGSKSILHCAVGVVGQALGPYIDMPGVLYGTSSLTNDVNRATTAFHAGAVAQSALEWGTLSQNLSKVNVGSVSTVNLFDIANTAHDVLYNANSSNWSAITPLLSNYASNDLNNISGLIQSGYRVILPQHGNLTQNGWTGVGYIAMGPDGVISHYISSNLKGGYPDQGVGSGAWVPDATITAVPIVPPPQVTGNDPIDLSSGAFLYDHDDISIGSAPLPYGLSFRRSYNSNNLYTTGPLGPGWTHGFAISAIVNSDGLKGMGQDSPIDGAAAIAASYVIQDLLSDSSKPLDKVVIATLAQK